MTWDLDDILGAAGGTRRKPQLVEVGRAFVRGRAETAGYFWSTGRIGATAGTGWVRMHRRFGVVSDGIRIDAETLHPLAIACRHWARHRDEWAAFYYSGAGYPPGFGGGACYYQAAGKRGERITVGRVGCLGHNKTGADLVGTNEVVKIEPRRSAGAIVVAEIWRRGERQGPTHGSLVGLRYMLGGKVFLDALRNEARLWCGRRGEVYLEPEEEGFVVALRDVMKTRPRSRSRPRHA